MGITCAAALLNFDLDAHLEGLELLDGGAKCANGVMRELALGLLHLRVEDGGLGRRLRRRARRAHARAVDAPEVPIDAALAVETYAQCLDDPVEGAVAAPAVEAMVDALPRSEPLGQFAPWRACWGSNGPTKAHSSSLSSCCRNRASPRTAPRLGSLHRLFQAGCIDRGMRGEPAD